MFDSLIEQIKEKLDIVDFIGSYLKLQKTGINYRALCPFHSEKTPSFFVSPSRQIWRCFGCNRGGSVFDFLMEIEGIEFKDALKTLAQKTGIELKKEDIQIKTERQRLLEICEIACCFFEKQLNKSKAGEQIKNYLFKRGLKEESIKKWRLGYSPNNWQAMSDFLVSQGYKREEIVKAGLTIKKEGVNLNEPDIQQIFYDRFRQRIIFPIFNLNSQVIGFAGRLVSDQEQEGAKYINTSNTLLYNKSQILYGLNFAKLEIRKKDFVILTEGYLDAILSHQAGFENTVAASGTALTEQHLKVLKRCTNNIYISFDMDLAGDAATQRSIDLALKEDFNIRVVILPKDSDPAEIICQNPSQWSTLLKKAEGILDFYFQNAFSKFDAKSSIGKKEIAKIILPRIKNIPNRILQSHWIQELAKKIKINEEAIWEELKKISSEENKSLLPPIENQIKNEIIKNRQQLLEEKILSLILENPDNLNSIDKDNLSFFSPTIKTILDFLKDKKDLTKIEEENKEIKEILNRASLLAEIIPSRKKRKFFNEVKNLIPDEGEIDLTQEMEICLRELKKIVLEKRLKNLSQKIQEAEEEKQEEKIKNLTENFTQLAIKLQNVKDEKNKK